MIRSVITGFGHAFPKRVVTNQELEKTVDTNDAWIVQRTGIKQRHIAGEGETSDITWNFEKFLVDRSGQVVARWAPQTTPEDIAEQLGPWL